MFFAGGIAAAQITTLPGPDTVIERIELRGLDTVSEQLVRSQMETRAGAPLSLNGIARDVKRLYGLRRFTNIRVIYDDVTQAVIFEFEETRIIDEVRIIGNRKIRDRAIRAEITWREGDAFVAEGYADERERVLDLYKSKGFLNASVDIVVEDLSENRVRVTYVLEEGRKARVRSITFVGNDALTKRRLNKIMKTNRRRWIIGGKFEEAQFEEDLRNIRAAYGDVGRLEAEIARTEFEYSPNGKRFDITLYLNEGPEYTVATVDFENNQVFGDEELRGLTTVKEGAVHNVSAVDADAGRITNTYLDAGYVNARANDFLTINRDDKTTNVTHQVEEDSLKYIRQIKITGNDVTRDDVIRREILLEPGDRYDGTLKRLSEQRLGQLQYFEPPPRLSLSDPLEDERFTDILVDVQEGRTGNFNFGATASTDDAIAGFVEVDFRNFDITNWPSLSGGGQRLNARLLVGTRQNNFTIGFSDPEIFGYPFSLGVNLFRTSFETSGASDFREESLGGQVTLGKRLSTFNTLSTSLRYRDTDIDDLGTFLDPSLRELEDPGSVFSNIWTFNRNTLDNFLLPKNGANHLVSAELAGLIGDNEFVKFNHDSTWYHTFNRFPKFTFFYRTREGIADAYGSREFVPLLDRYYAGGTGTIRGYEPRDVGPKAVTFENINGVIVLDDEAIGGHLRLLNTVEARYDASELINLFAFVDGGGVWLEPEDFDPGDLQFGAGLGIGINLPIVGPIRVDYGVPLNLNDDNDSKQSGRVHLRASFTFR